MNKVLGNKKSTCPIYFTGNYPVYAAGNRADHMVFILFLFFRNARS